MADRVSRIHYLYLTVPNRAGQGAKVLAELKTAGVSLLAYSGFPGGAGKAQLDLAVEDPGEVRRVAKSKGWSLSEVKKAFLVQGDDKVGAVCRHIEKLAAAGISVTAADAVAAGAGRYGMILWVKAKDHNRAARALGAR